MGRQANALCCWKGQTAEATALLESTEIILRGNIRARIPRPSISQIKAESGTLTLAVCADTLTLDLGAQAETWAAILRKPPPSLREKLGLAPGALGFVLGAVADEPLCAALHGLTTANKADAAFIIAEIHAQAGLTRALSAAVACGLPLWLIHEKGAAAAPKDSEIRAFMRAAGYIDTKSTAVSVVMTATLYRQAR